MFSRRVLLAATMLAPMILGGARSGHAEGGVYPEVVPPVPTPVQVDQAAQTLGNPIDKPVTGALEVPAIVGGEAPPSLEALQATRPGDQHGDGPRDLIGDESGGGKQTHAQPERHSSHCQRRQGAHA